MTEKVRTSEFVQKLSRGQVSSANWLGKEIHGSLGSEDGSRAYEVTVPEVDSAAGAILLTQLMQSNVNWTIEKPPVSSAVLGALSVLAFPLMIIALIYFMVLRPAQMRHS
jgi:ATP-dependent Zn protease